MKKIIAALMVITLSLTLFSCKNKDEHNHEHESTTEHSHAHSHDPSGAEVVTTTLSFGYTDVFNADEDAAYHDLFYTKNTAKYENKEFTKTGIFAVIYDAYNLCERYYVWGYGDEAKGCCWQWEFTLPENTEAPAPGSLIEVKGKMTASDASLDGYWLTDTAVKVKKAAEKTDFDYDLVSMSPTLTRVQLINMFNKSDFFKSVSIRIFGKTTNENTLAPAFTEDSWSLHFTSASSHIDTGSLIILEGIFNTEANANMVESTKIITEA